MSSLLIALGVAAAMALTGVLAVVVGIYGRVPREDTVFRAAGVLRGRLRRPRDLRARVLWAAAGAAVPAVWVATGWPAAAALVGIGIVAVPYLFGAGRIAQRRIARLAALDEWTRRLADSIGSGGALIATIVASAEHAPAAIATDVQTLAARLSTPRWDKQAALRRFADSCDDALGDLVVLALQLAVSTQGAQRVAELLRDIARQVSDEVGVQRAIDADRAEPRSVARNILVVLAGLVVAVMLAGRFTAPYDSPEGQAVLAIFGAVAFAALLWMRRIQVGQRVPRVLATAETAQPSQGTLGGVR